jgi:hypothetical protein
MKSPVLKKKTVKEKATGETYPSKKAMMKHEKGESKAEMKKEYGKVKSPIKQTMSKGAMATPKPTAPTKGTKSVPTKMKKC